MIFLCPFQKGLFCDFGVLGFGNRRDGRRESAQVSQGRRGTMGVGCKGTLSPPVLSLCPPGMGTVTMPTLALGGVTLAWGHHTDPRVSCLPCSGAD